MTVGPREMGDSLVRGRNRHGFEVQPWYDRGTDRLCFVVETKSSAHADDLRVKEAAKIECGKAHFQALATSENPARCEVARSLEEVLAKVG